MNISRRCAAGCCALLLGIQLVSLDSHARTTIPDVDYSKAVITAGGWLINPHPGVVTQRAVGQLVQVPREDSVLVELGFYLGTPETSADPPYCRLRAYVAEWRGDRPIAPPVFAGQGFEVSADGGRVARWRIEVPRLELIPGKTYVAFLTAIGEPMASRCSVNRLYPVRSAAGGAQAAPSAYPAGMMVRFNGRGANIDELFTEPWVAGADQGNDIVSWMVLEESSPRRAAEGSATGAGRRSMWWGVLALALIGLIALWIVRGPRS